MSEQDSIRLEWLQNNESDLVCHREKGCEGYTIWWNVIKRCRSISGHPLGSLRAAIDAAMGVSHPSPDPPPRYDGNAPTGSAGTANGVEIAGSAPAAPSPSEAKQEGGKATPPNQQGPADWLSAKPNLFEGEAKPEAPAGITKKRDTPESAAHWDFVEETARRVDGMLEWKQNAICEAPAAQAEKREGLCEDCGKEYPTPWFVANELWNQVVEISTNSKNFICMHCFVKRADKVIRCTGWEIVPENKVSAPAPSGEPPALECCRRQFENIIYCLDRHPDMLDSMRAYAETGKSLCERKLAESSPVDLRDTAPDEVMLTKWAERLAMYWPDSAWNREHHWEKHDKFEDRVKFYKNELAAFAAAVREGR